MDLLIAADSGAIRLTQEREVMVMTIQELTAVLNLCIGCFRLGYSG